jgi:hypothetical protein
VSHTADAEIPWHLRQPVLSAPSLPQRPRPIGISSYEFDGWHTTEVLYDNGTVWRLNERDGVWTRLPPIPQGDA